MKPTLRLAALGLSALFLLILGASDLLAEEKTATWTPPTTRESGAPLPASELGPYSIECGHDDGGPYSQVAMPPADATQAVIEFSPGDWYCVIYATDTEDRRSGPSTQVFFIVAPLPPNPPAAFSID